MFVFCVCLLCGDAYFVFAAYLDQDSLVEEILYLNGTFLVKYVNQNVIVKMLTERVQM